MQPTDGLRAIDASATADSFILDVPYRSQYDASPYQNSNCGPSALAMVLKAYGLDVPNDQLRAIANQLQGTNGHNDGVALEYLQAIARQAGLRTEGLNAPDGRYRQWTMSDIIHHIRQGYPVITLVHFAALPNHAGTSSTSDHYIVIVGLTSNGFVINDPATADGSGYHQVLGPEQLFAAWRASSIPQQGVAFLPPSGTGGVRPIVVQAALAASTALASALTPVPRSSAVAAIPPATDSSTGTGADPSPPAIATFVGPAGATWTRRVTSWQHAPVAPTAAPPISVSGDSSGSLVLAARDTANPPLTFPLVVIVIVGLIAIAIVKAPRSDAD